MRYLYNSLVIVSIFFSSSTLFCQVVFDSSLVRFQQIIHFDSGEFEIDDLKGSLLDSLILQIKQSQNLQLYIDAHTDDKGTNEFNMELSKKRQQSVHKYLSLKGIDDDRIISRSHGEYKLAIAKKDSVSRHFNRRVILKAFDRIKFIRISGQIVDEETNEGVLGTVEIEASNFKDSVKTDNKGHYNISFPLDEITVIDFYAKGYFFNTKRIQRKDFSKMDVTSLKRASLGSKLILKNINFYGNQNVLIPKSNRDLYKLFRFMEINKEVCIELAGHINSYGKSFLGKEDLSIARALIIYEKLKDRGVNEDRIVARGYGDLFKLFINPESDYEMEANRRVEIIISDCDSIYKGANDTLVNPIYYSNIAINRKFNRESFKWNLRYFYHLNKSEIMFKVRSLIANGEDPSQYSYGELLQEGQKLKYKDNFVAMILRNIYKTDQELRNKSRAIEEFFGLDSEEYNLLWDKINKQDSLNVIEVKKILDRRGWLSSEEVSGNGNAALFLVIQHADLNTQLQYLPMIQEAVKNGNASGIELAMLEDRVAIGQGEKQIYGSQIHRNKETGSYYVAPLIDPKEVNKRRKKVGLGLIEDYLARWGIDWDKELLKMLTNDK